MFYRSIGKFSKRNENPESKGTRVRERGRGVLEIFLEEGFDGHKLGRRIVRVCIQTRYVFGFGIKICNHNIFAREFPHCIASTLTNHVCLRFKRKIRSISVTSLLIIIIAKLLLLFFFFLS